MTDYFLQITLQSPLTASAGEGRVGLVDRDIAFDDLGLPILPGRRLKGLWRDAYRDVVDAWKLCKALPTEDDSETLIFGETGQSPNLRLHVANAELKEAADLKEWLEYLQDPQIQKLHPDDIVQHFATIRTQTAINRQTGAAHENTLRFTRTLQADWVFRAPVIVAPPDKAVLDALALGAAALQYMGTGRTRGLGKVHCCLITGDANNQECDLTEQALQALKDGAFPTISVTAPQKSIKQASPPPSSCYTTPTHLLLYRLTLREPAVIPAADGDLNTVVTRQEVPGSNVWGAAAWHYLRQPNHTPNDPDFRRVFLDGGLRFLTAYPQAIDNNTPQRLIPIPHSVRQFKDGDTLVDFVEGLTNAPTKRLDRRYARIGTSKLETQPVKTERNYHHARAGDRRKGRALENDGNIFRYEAIQADQLFQGAVLGSIDDLVKLKKWLPEGSLIRIGKSRSAQYGETKIEWIDDVKELSGLVEWDGFVATQTPVAQFDLEEEWDDDEEWDAEEEERDQEGLDGFVEQQTSEQLVITTLSPLLSVNEHGHPEARFPEHELVKALRLGHSTKTPILSRSYTRTELIGGYNAHLRLPRQQLPAIAAGSVFIFDITTFQEHITEDHLLQLERDGLGVCKGEGYGRIAVNRQNNLYLTNCEEERLEDPEDSPVPDSPSQQMPEKVRDLLQGIVRTRCLSDMQQDARDIANQATKENKIPSNTLLGRLRLFLRQDSLVESLENLRGKRAEEQLSNYKINSRDFKMQLSNSLTLYDLFQTAGTTPDSLTGDLIEFWVEQLAEDCDEDTRTAMIKTLVENQSAPLCRDFLDYLLTALRRKSPA